MAKAKTAVEVERQDGWLARGDLSLRTQLWKPRGDVPSHMPVVVIMHGYGEHVLRYDEVARNLVQAGHLVCGFDARGHGDSPGQRGHVRAFAQYVDDLEAYLRHVAGAYPGHPLVLLGHSNGGLIAARLAERDGMPLSGLILTSPLFGLQPRHAPLPRPVAAVVSWLLPRLPVPNGIKSWELTRDETLQKASDDDPWMHGKSTPRWYHEALIAMEEARMEAPRVQLPLLTVLGEDDPVVNPEAIARTYELMGSQDRTLLRRPGARHEVLNETDRHELYQRIAAWIAERFAATP